MYVQLVLVQVQCLKSSLDDSRASAKTVQAGLDCARGTIRRALGHYWRLTDGLYVRLKGWTRDNGRLYCPKYPRGYCTHHEEGFNCQSYKRNTQFDVLGALSVSTLNWRAIRLGH